jgi:hypothetical protein
MTHNTEIALREILDPAVTALEQQRKADPGAFHSNLGRKEYGSGYKAANTLAGVLRGYAARLERLT